MSCNFESFVKLGTKLPPHISRIIEGDHGIGKSVGVRQIADSLNLPVLDIRLALVTEGDFIGMPIIEEVPFKDKKKEVKYQKELKESLEGLSTGASEAVVKSLRAKWSRQTVTKFSPPEFIIECGKTAHVLFLDEFNRATPEVKQAAFQLILDRNINGHYVHEDTIIFAAMNTGSQYHVEPLDPALYDRFAVIKLEPTIDEWLSWARKNLIHEIADFISQWPDHLEHRGDIEPYKVYPSRRSWERLNNSLSDIDLREVSKDGSIAELVFLMSQSLVGVEAAVSFLSYVKNCKKNVTVKEIIDDFGKVERHIDFDDYDALNGVIERVAIHCKENKWNKQACKNIAAFQRKLSPELAITLWRKLVTANADNGKTVHYMNKDFILECIGEK